MATGGYHINPSGEVGKCVGIERCKFRKWYRDNGLDIRDFHFSSEKEAFKAQAKFHKTAIVLLESQGNQDNNDKIDFPDQYLLPDAPFTRKTRPEATIGQMEHVIERHSYYSDYEPGVDRFPRDTFSDDDTNVLVIFVKNVEVGCGSSDLGI